MPLEECACKLALTFCMDIVPVLLDHTNEGITLLLKVMIYSSNSTA